MEFRHESGYVTVFRNYTEISFDSMTEEERRFVESFEDDAPEDDEESYSYWSWECDYDYYPDIRTPGLYRVGDAAELASRFHGLFSAKQIDNVILGITVDESIQWYIDEFYRGRLREMGLLLY